MIARSLVVAGVLAWSAGCIVPRAAGYGLTAVPIPAGGADVGLALGGIYQQTERTTVTKVPWLGDIPVVGNLFKDQFKQNNRTELLIFITPRVISEKVTQAARS